jgi:hypothetical protein
MKEIWILGMTFANSKFLRPNDDDDDDNDDKHTDMDSYRKENVLVLR